MHTLKVLDTVLLTVFKENGANVSFWIIVFGLVLSSQVGSGNSQFSPILVSFDHIFVHSKLLVGKKRMDGSTGIVLVHLFVEIVQVYGLVCHRSGRPAPFGSIKVTRFIGGTVV